MNRSEPDETAPRAPEPRAAAVGEADRAGRPDEATCEIIQARARAFLAGGDRAPSKAEILSMRAHLADCAECDAAYHEEAEFVARLGAENRRTRERKGVPRQGRRSRWRYVAAPRQTRLRLILIPAFAIFLMTQSDRLRSRAGWRLEALEGAVIAADDPVVVTETSRRLISGESCSTGPGGRAVLRFGDSRLVLGPETEVVLGVESSRSIRFVGGNLTVGGPCRVQSALGLIDLAEDSSGRIEYTQAGFAVECLTGSVDVQDATGSSTLAPGEVLER